MKKLLIIFSVAIAVSPFVSCKKMKDDIKDLKDQVNTLNRQLGADEPITATTTFDDNTGATRTVKGTYYFKTTDYYSQRMIKNSDGTYAIRIERFEGADGTDGAGVSFTYNPTTKAVTNISGSHDWTDADPYKNYVEYSGTYTGLTMTVTVDNLDVTTGAISVKFSASGTAAYTAVVTDNPNPGKPCSTNFSFVGKLKIFDRN
jgi:hypothetical protein